MRAGSGVRLSSAEFPDIEVQSLAVDLVQGLVRSDSRSLGPFFDGALTVALCSALRHLLDWRPGVSAFEAALRRRRRGRRRALPFWARRPFARVDLGARPELRVRLDLGGDGLRLTFRRPALLRILGITVHVFVIRYLFSVGKVEVESDGVGPLRRLLLGLVARLATRWLRPRLPSAMRQPDYDLFADADRRAQLEALARRLRPRTRDDGRDRDGYDAAHPLARGAAGPEAGRGGMVSPAKAAVITALGTLKITADRAPASTRVLLRAPLGPVSSLAIATDRGGDMVVVKRATELELAAPLGLYAFADQFPELAELRLVRVAVELAESVDARLVITADPPLGPAALALVDAALRRSLLPRLPLARLRAEAGDRHRIWRQGLGDGRALIVDTDAGAEVSLHHGPEAWTLRAPAGLVVRFEGLPLPPATLSRITLRHDDGVLTVDGAPALGGFGEALLARLARANTRAPAFAGLGLRIGDGPPVDPGLQRAFPALWAEFTIPAIGDLEVRADPQDTARCELRPTELLVTSERGLVILATTMGLALTIRRARYDVVARRLEITASPPPGAYIERLVALLIESMLLPLLRRALPMGPEPAAAGHWQIERAVHPPLLPRLEVGVKLSLPPGAGWILGRSAEALEIGTSAPLEILGRAGPLAAELTATRLAWRPRDGRVDLDTQPPAGPLATALLARLLAALTPGRLRQAVSERLLGITAADPPSPPALPVGARLFDLSLPVVGDVSVILDPDRIVDAVLRPDDASLRLGAGATIHLDGLGLQLRLRRVDVRFMPLTVDLDATPAAGELERELAAQVIRSLLPRVMRLFWPPTRRHGPGGDTLLATAAAGDRGPLELRVHDGGALRFTVDREGATLSSARGVFLSGDAVAWLPRMNLHRLRYRFRDGAIELRVGGIIEHHYREYEAIGPLTEKIGAHLFRVLIAPHLPAWTQRLGMRVLPPLPELVPEPARRTIWRAQLPGGRDVALLRMHPEDALLLRASREELKIESARALHLEVPGLRLRVPFTFARYHMESGEIHVGGLGRVENAIAEAILRRELVRVDPTVDADDREITLIDVLDRFPVDDEGRRIVFADRLVRLLFAPETTIVAAIDERGLRVTAEPGLVVDGVAGLDYLIGGVRYAFEDAAFHLDLDRDSLIAGVLKRLIRGEAEALLGSLLRPLLPRAMRTPGYSFAADPDPSRTVAALLRTLSFGALGRRAGPSAPARR